MAPRKPTTTITKTVKGVTEFVEHSTDVQLAPMPDSGRPYILESAQFNEFLLAKRQAAAREIEDIDGEIKRLQIELEARLDRRKDLMNIVIRADAALQMGVDAAAPSPRLVTRNEDAA